MNGVRARAAFERLQYLVMHPYLVSFFPILALYAANLHELRFSQVARSLVFFVFLTTLLLLALRLITRNWHVAGAGATLFLLLFFSYGHVYHALEGTRIGALNLGRHRFLVPVFACGLALGVFVIQKTRPGRDLTRALNAFALVLLVIPLISVGGSVIAGWTYQGPPQGGADPTIALTAPQDQVMPDIYYIILDAFARQDVMADPIGYDNRDFIDFLDSKGFFVAGKSNANHNWTALSISSTLNMAYAQDLGLNLIPGSYPAVFVRPIHDSLVRQSLENLGYKTVALRSSYIPTEIQNADLYLEPDSEALRRVRPPLTLNEFEGLLSETTAAKIFSDLWVLGEGDPSLIGGQPRSVGVRESQHSFAVLREIILTQFDDLASAPSIPGPKFVFAHIIAPHNPYLFGPNGEAVAQRGPYTLQNNDQLPEEEEIRLYRDQATYISARMEDVVQQILTDSPVPPVIIIQADHGIRIPGLTKGENRWRQFAILNAYHLPGDCSRLLYPSITPVNTFRIVFNCYFGGRLPPVPDKSFYTISPRKVGYDFEPMNEH